MPTITIAYHTGNGHTLRVAEHVLAGLTAVGCQASLIDVDGIDDAGWAQLRNSDGIIFGSPTYMGSVSGPFKSFMDASSNFWIEQHWADKIGAAFTVGASASGDKLNSLVQMSIFAAQHGMIWVGQNHVGSKHTGDGEALNQAGSWLGLMAQSSDDKASLIVPEDVKTAERFGRRVGHATIRWATSEAAAE
ncbi:MAG: flavodoxin family protein [Alphaproteobacteria bacterium]|nr:flavodoxin family protein [Alphaproteobacteria bacterium SS10]